MNGTLGCVGRRMLAPATTARGAARAAISCRVLAWALAGMLAACGSPQHRDAPAVPAAYVSGPVAEPASEAALANWWDIFDDPLLADVVRQAQAGNRDVAQAMAAVAQARASLRGVRAELFPTVDLGGEAGQQRVRSEGTDIELLELSLPAGNDSIRIDTWNAAVQASWEIDVFGATRARRDAGALGVEAALAQAGAARLAVTANAAMAYLEIRGLQARQAVLAESLDIARQAERIGELRFEIGEVTRLDVEALAAERAALQVQAAELDILLAEAGFALDTLLAVPPGTMRARLAQPAPIPLAGVTIPSGQPADLLGRRPDVLAEIAQLRAAEYEALAARRDVFPTLALNAAVGRQGMEIEGLFSSVSRFAQIGALFAWPLLDFGRRQSAIEVADVAADTAFLSLEQTLAAALEEVERALVQIDGRGRQQTAVDEALARRANAHRLALLSYEVGEADLADVLDAQRGLLDGRQQMIETRSALATAQVALYTALGGGWRRAPQEAGEAG